MSRGSVRCLSLLVCVCFTLSMLFSNTLVAKAYSSGTVNVSQTFNYRLYPDSGLVTQYIINEDGSFRFTGGNASVGSGADSSSGEITVENGIKYFNCDIETDFYTPDNKFAVTNYDSSKAYISFAGWQYSFTSSVGSIINNSVSYSGQKITNTRYATKSASGVTHSGVRQYNPSLTYKGHFTYAMNNGADTSAPIDFTITVSFKYYIDDATAEEVASNSTPVSDVGTQSELSDLNDSTDAIEQSVTSDTGGGILATIKNFFGSFFQNVFDTLVSVFVPEEGFFSDWFNRLNTLLSEKLGMLYAPFDLLITTLTAIMNADSTESGIPFPGIKWEDTWLVEPFTFTFSSLGDSFNDLREYVYFATDTVLLFAFLYLLQNKVRLILEGHESG